MPDKPDDDRAAPARIQRQRKRGWRMPPNTVDVSRGSIWGNPYVVGGAIDMRQARRIGWHMDPNGRRAETAAEAVRLFALCLAGDAAGQYAVKKHLAGKNLACWCAPGAPCHADVLLAVANGLPLASVPGLG